MQIDQSLIKMAKVGRCYLDADAFHCGDSFQRTWIDEFRRDPEKHRNGLCYKGR